MSGNLTEDQKEELKVFFDGEAYRALLAAMSQIIQKQAEGVLSIGNDQMVEERAKYNGMLNMRRSLMTLRDELIGKPAKPKKA